MMTKKQIRNALNFKNDFIVNHFHDLSINSEVLIWRKNNADKTSQWIDLFKMLNMKNETCKIAMSYETIDFRNIVIKLFFKNESENVKNVKKNENIDHVDDKKKMKKHFFQIHFIHLKIRSNVIAIDQKNYHCDIKISRRIFRYFFKTINTCKPRAHLWSHEKKNKRSVWKKLFWNNFNIWRVSWS